MFSYSKALVRGLSPKFSVSALSEEDRSKDPIDQKLAEKQHENYVSQLEETGVELIKLDAEEMYPDCCFVEDLMVAVQNVVLISRLGASSRMGEEKAARTRLSQYPQLKIIEMKAPATLDGGDVLVMPKEIFVGLSSRTNEQGVEAVRETFPDKKVIAIPVKQGLHLKSMISVLDENTIVFAEIPASRELYSFLCKSSSIPYEAIFVPDPIAANVLRVNQYVVVQEGFPKSFEILSREIEKRKLILRSLKMSEFIKADGALTCCSVLYKF